MMKKLTVIFWIFFIVLSFASCSDDEKEPYVLPDVEPILLNGTWFRTDDISTTNSELGALLLIKGYLAFEANNIVFTADHNYIGDTKLTQEVIGKWELVDNEILYLDRGTDKEIMYTILKADEIEMEWELYYASEEIGASKDAYVNIIMHKHEHDYSDEEEEE